MQKGTHRQPADERLALLLTLGSPSSMRADLLEQHSEEYSVPRPLRIVVWSTGGVGSIAIDAIAGRPDLELAGVWVHSAAKVGQDAGVLAGRAALGVQATNDADALIELAPTAWCTRRVGQTVTAARCRTICVC